MAKLVDLLAKHLKEWPDGQKIIVQDYDKECKQCECLRAYLDEAVWIRDTPGGCNFYLDELASDWSTAKVTYKQWLAARDRLHAEAVKEMRQTTNADADQALWDKVAVAAIGGVTSSDAFHNYANFQGNPDIAAAFAVQVADAFMAERAKRMKGGV